MADALKIVQTVISVSKHIHSVVKSIQGATDEIRTLDREVSRVLPILEHLLETLGDRAQEESRERDARALQSLCDEARELVDRATDILKKNSAGAFRLHKKDWPRWLMKKTDREELAKRLYALYISTSAYLS